MACHLGTADVVKRETDRQTECPCVHGACSPALIEGPSVCPRDTAWLFSGSTTGLPGEAMCELGSQGWHFPFGPIAHPSASQSRLCFLAIFAVPCFSGGETTRETCIVPQPGPCRTGLGRNSSKVPMACTWPLSRGPLSPILNQNEMEMG